VFKIKTWYRDLFWEWCQQNNIVCEYQGTERIGIGVDTNAYDTWYIDNEKDQIFAMLKWS
jgi:hypothetical protein